MATDPKVALVEAHVASLELALDVEPPNLPYKIGSTTLAAATKHH